MIRTTIKIQQEVEDFLRNSLKERIGKLFSKQRDYLNLIYPGGPERMDESSLLSAIDLCDRTIMKNEANLERMKQ